MKALHRLTGILVSVFVVMHLTNHVMAWWGIETHLATMKQLRRFYRHPLVEIPLVAAFLFQAYSGIRLLWTLRGVPQKSTYQWIQCYSGILLGAFILIHLSATFFFRWVFALDTNFYFASRVVLQSPDRFFFIPYYLAGILSFGVHVASVHRQKMSELGATTLVNAQFYGISLLFLLIALQILFVFTGGRYPIEIPEIYNVF
ncbi:MAG: hypothetical protein AAGH79_16525 [Bacteroidota bacterium]